MSPIESLILAIHFFLVNKAEQILKSDQKIKYTIRDHYSVLHIAVRLIDFNYNNLWRRLNASIGSEVIKQLIEVLLQSGRCNVNALAHSSKTPLHLAVSKCIPLAIDDNTDLVTAVVELLLKNKANANAKTSDGETPLMMASERGCSPVVQLLLEWRDEYGAGVDLNARDIYGETALIKAAKWASVDVVELLLKRGCLDEFYDLTGLYALHASILGPEFFTSCDISSEFLGSIGLDASEKTLTFLNRCGADAEPGRTIGNSLSINNGIQKIVRMLVEIGRSDVDSQSFRGLKVLDLAIGSKLRISQKTIETLKKHTASFDTSVNKSSKNPENSFKLENKLGKTPFHRFCAILTEISVEKILAIPHLANLLNSSPCKEMFEAMAVRKDNRGRTALHYAVMNKHLRSEDAFQLINDLKLKPIINERDNYGRSSLHYCHESVYASLVEHGADEHIRDVDGKSPKDLRQLRKKGDDRKDLPTEATEVLESLARIDKPGTDLGVGSCRERTDDIKKGNQLIRRKLDPWMIWRDSKYAYRDQFSTIMREKVQQFIDRLSDEIGKRDPRFECRPVLIGSSEEGTKIGLPDEFDFNFILTKLSEVCEVVPSPEAPCGFVHIKRRHCSAENREASQDFKSREGFDRFFNSNGFLLTENIASKFRILYTQILSEPEFWHDEVEVVFEWDPINEIGLVNSKAEGLYGSQLSKDIINSTHLCSTIELRLNRPLEGRYMFKLISLDIVPCIKISGWWPEDALSNVNDEIKVAEYHLVFDQPQRRYPWVPFSDPFARISFAPTESRIIRECSAVAKAAYMVTKQLINYFNPNLTYVLKTCLLYCIEALKDNTRSHLVHEDINPTELRIYVEKLMFCFHEFYLQDFLPCYMMPSFHLSIDGHFKSNHIRLLNDISFRFPLFAHSLYFAVCTTESPLDFCPPTPEPLCEKFNREQLMRKLSTNT